MTSMATMMTVVTMMTMATMITMMTMMTMMTISTTMTYSNPPGDDFGVRDCFPELSFAGNRWLLLLGHTQLHAFYLHISFCPRCGCLRFYELSWYLSRPAVVYFFQASVLFCKENVKFATKQTGLKNYTHSTQVQYLVYFYRPK